VRELELFLYRLINYLIVCFFCGRACISLYMKFSVLTLFPQMITSYCSESILGRGQKHGHITVRAIDIRDFAHDRHRTVDDTPYGGGAGMLMKPEPIYEALMSIDGLPFAKAPGLTKLKRLATGTVVKKKRTVLLSPRGRQFDQATAASWSHLDELILICGRYEGIDQRVIDHMIDEEVSVGPYVLAGGELGALAIIEATSRLVPGVLGNAESLVEETFNKVKSKREKVKKENSKLPCLDLRSGAGKTQNSKFKFQDSGAQSGGEDLGGVTIEYPQYTKPADFKGWKVPDVLLSGDHGKIAQWRKRS